MRRSEIEAQNQYLLRQQRDFRMAADVVTRAWMAFPEVEAVAVIGSVAKRLWKEVPRFREYRWAGVEVWHECGDLDLALWISSPDRLGQLRRVTAMALKTAFETGMGISVVTQQVDVFLFEPGSDRYLGRLCRYNTCPKGKMDCLVPGCGEVAFNKVIPDFEVHADLLAGVEQAMLFRRGEGQLRSALELPTPDADS